MLLARVAVVVACDLHQRELVAIAAERQLDYCTAEDPERTTRQVLKIEGRRQKAQEAARQSAYRDRREGRKLLRELGGLPWAAFPNGKLTDRWWQSEEFAAALDVWYGHAYQLAYRDGWERPVGMLSPAQEVVYVLLHLRDGPQLRPETTADARAALEDDARASDAWSVDQWVARLVLAVRPGCPPRPRTSLVRPSRVFRSVVAGPRRRRPA